MDAKWSWLYDKLYSYKDYCGEATRLKEIIGAYQRSHGRRLLDVACGTGKHLEHLRVDFDVEGLDLDEGLLAIARQRNPGVPFHSGDMCTFELGQSYDIITCLFSAIGYVVTLERLSQAFERMASHLVPGGVLIVEPWFTPDAFVNGHPSGMFVSEPELKIARISTSFKAGHLSWFDFHYLVATPEGTEHLVEHHELGLFETEAQLAILSQLGLEATYDGQGLTGRGLLIAVKSMA